MGWLLFSLLIFSTAFCEEINREKQLANFDTKEILVKEFFHVAKVTPKKDEICLAIQCSWDRMEVLLEMLNSWGGCSSLALFVHPFSEMSSILNKLQLMIRENDVLDSRTDIHVVFEEMSVRLQHFFLATL